MSEMEPSLKEEIEKIMEERIPKKNKESTAVLQTWTEALALELRHQRELIQDGFDMINKRIEELQRSSDKHFEDMNRRFEDMNRRFEDMNKHFNTLQWMIGIGFNAITILMAFFRLYASSSRLI